MGHELSQLKTWVWLEQDSEILSNLEIVHVPTTSLLGSRFEKALTALPQPSYFLPPSPSSSPASACEARGRESSGASLCVLTAERGGPRDTLKSAA